MNRIPIVCWSWDERTVCLMVNDRKRWLSVEFEDGPERSAHRDPYCWVDGRKYCVGSTHATAVISSPH